MTRLAERIGLHATGQKEIGQAMAGRNAAVCLIGTVLILTLAYGCATVTTEMSPGERLYRANCASCHRLIGPDEHDATTWQQYVDEYGAHLDRDEKQQILAFLTEGR